MLYLFFNRKHSGTGVTLLFFINFINKRKTAADEHKEPKTKAAEANENNNYEPKEKKIIIVETKEKTAGQEDIWILQE